jgi:Protein of unknown function (DUF2490)
MYFKRIFVAAFFMLLIQSAFAQSSKNGNWFIYVGNQAINKKWNIHNEVQYRNYDFVGDLQQFVARVGIGYNLTEGNNNLLFGYAFVHSERYTTTDTKVGSNENRLWLQFTTRQRFQRVYLQHRYRAEDRYFANSVRSARLRYFLGVNVPINKPAMDKGAVYLSLYDEIFINTKSAYFDRNRWYAALGYAITPKVRTEIGFMSQGVETSQRGQFQVAVFNNLPFKKA